MILVLISHVQIEKKTLEGNRKSMDLIWSRPKGSTTHMALRWPSSWRSSSRPLRRVFLAELSGRLRRLGGSASHPNSLRCLGCF